MLHRRRLGFTLIELLVVISIIALLIGILLPALGSARRVSRELKCLTNIRSLGFAATIYAQDFDDQYPVPDEVNAPDRYLSLDTVMSGYDGRGVIKTRPDGQSTTAWFPGEVSEGVWQCPLDELERTSPTDKGALFRSYGITGGVPADQHDADPNGFNQRLYTGVVNPASFTPPGITWSAKQADIREASDVVFMTDWARATSYLGNAAPNDACVVPGWGMGGGFEGSGVGWPFGPSMFYAHERQLGDDPLPNGAFADGHAETVDVVAELEAVGNANPFPTFATVTRGTVFDWYQ